MAMYKKTTVDFIKRTKKNLEIIDQIATRPGEEAYEVTQLVNSLLGLLVMPQQQMVFERDVALSSLSHAGWPLPQRINGSANPESLSELLRLMRNSIAHWGLEFVEADGEISDLEMTNKPRVNANPNWVARMSIPELKIFVQKLSECILREVGPR